MSPFSPSLANFPAIQRELDAGERVFWTGQPDPARMAQRALSGAIVGVLMFCFSLFWIWNASTRLRTHSGADQTPDLNDIVFPAFGLIFVGVAIFMMSSPLLELLKAPRTFYALTDKRALIVVEGARAKIQSVMPSEFPLERQDKSNGRGDLIFKREISGGSRNRRTVEIGFFGIENAREVERMARQIV